MDMIEVRATLEGHNAKLAAQNNKSKDVDKLQKILVKGTKAIEKGDLDACKKLNSEFHNTLATIPGNTILRELVTSLRERTAIVFTANTILKVRENWLEHEQILRDRKSTRLNSSHVAISYAVFCFNKKKRN